MWFCLRKPFRTGELIGAIASARRATPHPRRGTGACLILSPSETKNAPAMRGV
jgi:hypothetical protein